MATNRRFSAQPQTIQKELTTLVRKLGATSLKINQDLFTGQAEIIFDRAGQRYAFRCTRYNNPMDNLRAAQLTITYLWRALEEYGVTGKTEQLDQTFAQFFLGFAALTNDTALLLGDGRAQWWEILGVRSDADKAEITNAYRALAKVHHPDVGGRAEDFKRLRAAYEEAISR